jgi:HPt (histidine-containing phosphotransfer) domain-containing protein
LKDIPDEFMIRYKQQIPKKLEELADLITCFLEKKKNLHSFFHKLKGNAGLYGYFSVSDICKEWENKLAENCDIEAVLEKIKQGFYDKE